MTSEAELDSLAPTTDAAAAPRGADQADDRVVIHGRELAVHLTPAARRALQAREAPLAVDLELFFSCLIRKQVRFPDRHGPGAPARAALGGRVSLRFAPVMTRQCSVTEEPELTAFPIADPAPFVPHWVRLDYGARTGWSGAFGYRAGAG
jgi:hypothetical protein